MVSANISSHYRNFIHEMELINVIILYNNSIIVFIFFYQCYSKLMVILSIAVNKLSRC